MSETEIILAARTNNLARLNAALARGADVNAENEFGDTALMVACELNHVAIVKQLLKVVGIDVNKANRGITPLKLAVSHDNLQIIDLLLAFPGIDVNKAPYTGLTPLHSVCLDGNKNILKRLLAVPSINVNSETSSQETPFYFACREGHLPIVESLLTIPAVNINKANIANKSPFFIACENGHFQIVKRLLAVPGLLINTVTNLGQTPLSIACSKDFKMIVERLLRVPDIEVEPALSQAKAGRYSAAMNHLVIHIINVLNTTKRVANISSTDYSFPLKRSVLNTLLGTGNSRITVPKKYSNLRKIRNNVTVKLKTKISNTPVNNTSTKAVGGAGVANGRNRRSRRACRTNTIV